MDNFIEKLIDKLQQTELGDVLELFNCEYLTVMFWFHVVFILYYIRCSTPSKGLPFYRSYLLGLLMSTAPLLVFSLFDQNQINSTIFKTIVFGYSICWALLNILPFDIAFKLVHNFKSEFKFLDSLAEFINLARLVEACHEIYKQNFYKTLAVTTFCLSTTVFVDAFDQLLNGKRLKPRAYPFFHIKRLLVFVAVYDGLSMDSDIFDMLPIPSFSRESAVPFLTGIYIFFTVIDIFFKPKSVFDMVDVVFPDPDDMIKYQPKEEYFRIIEQKEKRQVRERVENAGQD